MLIILPCFYSSPALAAKLPGRTKCMVIPTLINLNLVELKYYPFMISLDKWNGTSNILSPNVKVFIMIIYNKYFVQV